MTSWTNLEVIKGVAEDDAEVAKYYPEDQDFLLEFEPASGDFLDNLRSVAWNQRCRSSSRGPARACRMLARSPGRSTVDLAFNRKQRADPLECFMRDGRVTGEIELVKRPALAQSARSINTALRGLLH
jgi:hypothetical protein